VNKRLHKSCFLRRFTTVITLLIQHTATCLCYVNWVKYYFAHWKGARYCDEMSVCLSICPLAYLKKHMFKLHEIFCTCYPWLGPPPTTMQYVTYFRFCGWRHVLHNGANTDAGFECAIFIATLQVDPRGEVCYDRLPCYESRLKHKMLDLNICTKIKPKRKPTLAYKSCSCVCVPFCTTTVVYTTAKNNSDNFHSYPPHNRHCSDDVHWRGGAGRPEDGKVTVGLEKSNDRVALSSLGLLTTPADCLPRKPKIITGTYGHGGTTGVTYLPW